MLEIARRVISLERFHTMVREQHNAAMTRAATLAEREHLLELFSKKFRSAYFFFDDVKFDETIESLRQQAGEQG